MSNLDQLLDELETSTDIANAIAAGKSLRRAAENWREEVRLTPVEADDRGIAIEFLADRLMRLASIVRVLKSALHKNPDCVVCEETKNEVERLAAGVTDKAEETNV